jgi:hypothetical protein
LAALAVVLLTAQGGQGGHLYKWTDEKGEVHFSDDLYQLPPDQQEKELEKQEHEKSGAAGRPGKTGPRSTFSTIGRDDPLVKPRSDQLPLYADESKKVGWQNRVRILRWRIAGAKADRDAVKRRLDEATLATITVKTVASRQNKERYRKELELLNKHVAGLEDELNVKLPEEARRAGAPPGWLRVEQ